MVRIKIPKNNTNNEATVNQKAKKAINPFFQQMSSEKNNKPRQHLTCRFAAGKKYSQQSIDLTWKWYGMTYLVRQGCLFRKNSTIFEL